jgi:DBP10CT (NUC160) domain
MYIVQLKSSTVSLFSQLFFPPLLGVSKLENAFLDLQPDNALDLNKKRRLLRWDAKKRKFVKQSLEEMSNVKGLKRLRTESGAPIKMSKIPQVTILYIPYHIVQCILYSPVNYANIIMHVIC